MRQVIHAAPDGLSLRSEYTHQISEGSARGRGNVFVESCGELVAQCFKRCTLRGDRRSRERFQVNAWRRGNRVSAARYASDANGRAVWCGADEALVPDADEALGANDIMLKSDLAYGAVHGREGGAHQPAVGGWRKEIVFNNVGKRDSAADHGGKAGCAD
jgi:hypothetical protein